MSAYSIVKIGTDYVVKVDDQSVMTVRSRRKAIRLVAVASGMLQQTTSASGGAPSGTVATCLRPINQP